MTYCIFLGSLIQMGIVELCFANKYLILWWNDNDFSYLFSLPIFFLKINLHLYVYAIRIESLLWKTHLYDTLLVNVTASPCLAFPMITS